MTRPDEPSEIDRLQARCDALEREAVFWKGEALAHKSSLCEAYQLLTGATGEPATWNGARPFKRFLQADRDAFGTFIRIWAKAHFGKIITHRTAWAAFDNFAIERRVRAKLMHQNEEVT
jgi:hypothetical protein